MRNTMAVSALVLLASVIATDAGTPQATAIMKISGMPGQIAIQVDKTDWSRIQGMPDPTAPRTAGSTSPLGARGGGSLASRGGTLGGRGGAVQIQDIAIVKEVDSASPKLLTACTNGEHFPEATIEFVPTGGNDLEYLRVTLVNVVIQSVNTQGSGGEEPLEELTFSFGKASWEYRPIEPAQRSTPPFTRSTPTWP
ncbi:MAG: type VI secretion system tube protein Hcp [Thermoanaerobaculales bacterium]|nr:type VI secretion system tube protein Hcp [Thermoanaerobaculales bacterium]